MKLKEKLAKDNACVTVDELMSANGGHFASRLYNSKYDSYLAGFEASTKLAYGLWLSQHDDVVLIKLPVLGEEEVS